MRKVALAVPDLKGNEEQFAVNAIRSSWISSTGDYVNRFESEFAGLSQTKYAVGVCNGTVALHLALLALDVRPGDEVLVPSMTYIATANAVRYVGAEPIFVEIDPDTWCISPELLEKSITRRTKGIIAVDIYGHPADMDAINHIAAVHGLWVVEDAAESFGATYKGKPTGSCCKIGTFSFYGNKLITCGEGGALTLNDPSLHLRIKTLRGQGMDPQRRYYFPVIGYNFRLTNLACAILCAQLERYQEIIEKRRQIYSSYQAGLEGINGIGFQPSASWAVVAPWMYCITVDSQKFGYSRDYLMKYLAENGVDTRPFFIPIHTLPPYRQESRMRGENLPITDKLGESGMNLPTHTLLEQEDIDYICSLISKLSKSK